MFNTKARAVVSRQNNDVKHRICITKEKLDYYAKSYRDKNTSVIYDTIPLIQLLLTICNFEAALSHGECGCDESVSHYFVMTGTPDIMKYQDMNS